MARRHLDVRAAHALVAVGGIVLLTAVSWPVTFDGIFSAPSTGFVILVAASAVLIGGIGGLIEGMALRIGYRVAAVLVLLVASFPAFVMPALTIGRWGDDDSPVPTTDLFLPAIGWLLYVAVISAAAWGVSANTSSGVTPPEGHSAPVLRGE